MKRNFTIIFILSCFLFTSIILSQQCKKDEFMPTVKNGAVISSSQSVLASNLTSILHQIWIPNSWEDANRIVYTYNASGLLEKVSYDSLSNGSWKTFGSMTMAYNSSDQLIEEISSYYESDGTLVHGVKWTHSYSGNIMSEGIQYMWDVDNELWESYKKQIYTYTGDLITKIEDYSDMGDGSWELADENTFTYDGQSREIESLTQGHGIYSMSNGVKKTLL